MKIFKIAEQFTQDCRRRILSDLIKEIESGEFSHRQIDNPAQLYQMHNSVRHEYLSPKDNSGNNRAGQTMIWDMDAGMNEAF